MKTVFEIADLADSNLYAAAEAAESLRPQEVIDVLRVVEARPVRLGPVSYREHPQWKQRGNQARAQALASALEDAAIRAHGLEPDIMRKPQDRAAWAKIVKAAARALDRGRIETVRGFVSGQHVGRVAALWLWLGPNRDDRTALLASAFNVPANDAAQPAKPQFVAANDSSTIGTVAAIATNVTATNVTATNVIGSNDNADRPAALAQAA